MQPEPYRVPWSQHRSWLDHHWFPGQHVSVVGVTGGGKSYLVRHGLLPLWRHHRVLIVDVKGDDPSLSGVGQVVSGLPAEEGPQGRFHGERDPDQPRWYRLVVPEWDFEAGKRQTSGLERAQRVAGETLHEAYLQGDWVLVLDEARAITDPTNTFGLGLRGVAENIWQRGRSRRVTLIACTQQPLWMPSSFYSQPSLVYLGRMLEPPTAHFREIGGDTRLIRNLVPLLGRWEWLFVERDSGRMSIVKVGGGAGPTPGGGGAGARAG
jgi:hypothetical protein